MTDLALAHLCFACAIVHFLGARFLWRWWFRLPAVVFAVAGVALLAFAVALIRNGAPGGNATPARQCR